MKEDWKECKLGDVLVDNGYIRGPFGSALKRGDMKSEGIPVYEQQHAIYQIRDFRFFIDEKKFQEMKRFQVNENDLVISCSGTVGKITIISKNDPKGIISQALLILRVNPNIILPKYLQYFFISTKGYNSIISRSSGSVQVNIAKRNIIESIPLFLPPLATQQKIAKILSSLDDKIELNNKINDNLEQQAQAIFKSWFVDFEPFGGKMPEGWRIGKVAEIIELHDSKRIPLSGQQREKMEKRYPYYGATSLMDYVDNYIFDGIYLLLGEDGTVIDAEGYPILQYIEGKFWVNNHAHILTGKNGFSVEMLYILFSLTNVKDKVTGAVQQKISQGNLTSITTVIPTIDYCKKFDELIQPLFSQIRNNRNENQNLISLRDTLLPKLMSGEIEV